MSRERFVYALLSFTLLMPSLSAHAQSQTEQQWKEFQTNPKAFMDKQPIRRDSEGRRIKQVRPRFPVQAIKAGAHIEMKSAFRKGEDKRGRDLGTKFCTKKGVCMKDILEGRAASPSRIEEFFDARDLKPTNGRLVKRIDEMEKMKLREARLDETPWSDNYWPIYSGVLGNRYADRRFVGASSNWKGYYDFISKDSNSLLSIYESGDANAIDNLSPSEKYDLLIGDLKANNRVYKQGFLTPTMWKEGEGYWSQSGEVEAWMGICHGWAPAAYMLPRPTRAVTLTAADGKTPIKFYPSDLKALASYSWAKSSPTVRFYGGRCNDKNARKDSETGRLLDEDCFDTNPGDWHTAIVNQIGIAKRSFVMDATYDYEVWNQPVYGYNYRFFNPETGREVGSLKEATVTPENFSRDKFKKFRSNRTKYIVGVSMDVAYMMETQPTHAESDSPQRDHVETASYMYDLELNENGEIIGGEWYSNKHPDFIWTPETGSAARAPGDRQIPSDRIDSTPALSGPLPKFWADIAVANAVRTGTPLGTLVDKMVGTSTLEEAPNGNLVKPKKKGFVNWFRGLFSRRD